MEPTKKKLFNVTVIHELVVLADDEASAKEIADDAVCNREADVPLITATPMTHMPAGWTGECLPFCAGEDVDGHDDETIAVLMERGAAPDFGKCPMYGRCRP